MRFGDDLVGASGMKVLFESILRAAAAPELMEDALDAFCVEFGISSCGVISAREFDSIRVDTRRGGLLRRGGAPRFLEMVLSGQDAEDDPVYQRLFSMPPQRLAREIEVLGLQNPEQLPLTKTRLACRADGMLERIAAPLNRSGPWLDILAIHTFREGEGERIFRDRSAEVALPLFAHAIAMGRLLDTLRRRFDGALTVLDRLGLGVFLLSESGDAIHWNAEARRILDLGDGLAMSRARRLVAAEPEATAALGAMIARANRTAAGEGAEAAERLSLPRPSGAHPLLATMRPLLDHDGELEPGLRCAFLIVIDPARPGALSAEGLVALGGLTPKEAELTRLLVAGHRLADAAARRGVSVETARNQLKSLSAKLRCSGQADVIRLAAATRLPLE